MCGSTIPTEDEELEIVKRTTTDRPVELAPMLNAEQILELTRIVRKVPVADHVARYALRLARLTRSNDPQAPDFIREYVMWGAGPRASQYMVLGAKARAVLEGRYCVSHEDIQALASPVLRHRIKVNFNADAEGVTADDIISQADRNRTDCRRTRGMQVEESPRSLDPRTLAKLKGLHLRAQHIVEGYVAGLHRSPYHGFSIEFAEHREYAPGDDLRYVDWKVFGRTDKFYLKQYDDETNLICHLVLDVSESMSYRGPDAALSKFEYAQSAGRRARLVGPAAAGCHWTGDIRQPDSSQYPGQQQSVPSATDLSGAGIGAARGADGRRSDLS